MKKLRMLNQMYMVMFSMVFVLLLSFCCTGADVCAQTYYGSIEEMKQNMDWWESYTLGTKQQVLVERLEGVATWECQVMDSTGSRRYDLEEYFQVSENRVLCIDGYSGYDSYDGYDDYYDDYDEYDEMEIASGMYYMIFSTYENGVAVEGCIEIAYMALREMPKGQAMLVGSGECDYSIYQGDDFPYSITYTSSDPEIAMVDGMGHVFPQLKAGDVTITATVEYPNQEPVIYTGLLDVTDPSIQESVVVARKENLTIVIPGTSEYSSWYFSNKPGKTNYSNKKCSIDVYQDEEMGCLQLSISANNKKSSQKITMTVDGKVLTFKVLFSNPQLNKTVLVVKKGKKLTIPVKGTQKSSVVTCEMADGGIASVTKDGKVKGKKLGTTWMNIDVDGKTFYILLVVQKGKMYKVVKYAADQIGVAQYSQEKRMQKGYYDCSSLVWRSYKAAGLNIGNTTWALNSDGFANYYYKKGKHYVGKNLKSNKKLKCGDIIIRGKYKKGKAQTYHAELYIGDGYVIEAGGYGVYLSTTVGADIAVRPWP